MFFDLVLLLLVVLVLFVSPLYSYILLRAAFVSLAFRLDEAEKKVGFSAVTDGDAAKLDELCTELAHDLLSVKVKIEEHYYDPPIFQHPLLSLFLSLPLSLFLCFSLSLSLPLSLSRSLSLYLSRSLSLSLSLSLALSRSRSRSRSVALYYSIYADIWYVLLRYDSSMTS